MENDAFLAAQFFRTIFRILEFLTVLKNYTEPLTTNTVEFDFIIMKSVFVKTVFRFEICYLNTP